MATMEAGLAAMGGKKSIPRPGVRPSTPETRENSKAEPQAASTVDTVSKHGQQLSDVQRSLSFKALALSTEANGRITELYERVRKATVGEKALREEAELITRMHQLTAECFIGRASEKVVLRDIALDFGFELKSSEGLRGARVASVDPAGPAHKVGIVAGDIIASVDGRNTMGLDHVQVNGLIQEVIDAEKDMLVLSIAAPLAAASDGDTPSGNDTCNATDRPKPPSYMMIRNKLRREFGDAVYARCKRRVQNHMASLSSRYDIMGGNKPATPADRAMCYVNGRVSEFKETSRVWATWAREKWNGNNRAHFDGATATNSYSFADPSGQYSSTLLEELDESVTARARQTSNDIRLQETLQELLETEYPPQECLVANQGNDGILPLLAPDGVREYLARKHGAESVSRNAQHIEAKLQEREMMMVSL